MYREQIDQLNQEAIEATKQLLKDNGEKCCIYLPDAKDSFVAIIRNSRNNRLDTTTYIGKGVRLVPACISGQNTESTLEILIEFSDADLHDKFHDDINGYEDTHDVWLNISRLIPLCYADMYDFVLRNLDLAITLKDALQYVPWFNIKDIKDRLDISSAIAKDSKTGSEQDDKILCGIINNSGEWITEPKYDEIKWSNDGFIDVVFNGLHGIIGRTGKTIIEPILTSFTTFFYGAADITIGGKKGVLYPDGLCLITNYYIYAMPFSESLAFVAYQSAYGCINSVGERVIEPKFSNYPKIFKEGVAHVNSIYKQKAGYIDKTGMYVIDPIYDRAYSFDGGIAIVEVKGKQGIIDIAGNYICEPIFDKIHVPFTDGIAVIELNGKKGIINKKGEIILEPIYDSISSSADGTIQIILEGKKGYADKDGHILGPWINEIPSDSHDWKETVIEGERGYTDNEGRFISWPAFEKLWPFMADGLAIARFNGKVGFIDKSYNWVLKPVYDFAWDFSYGVAVVKLDGKFGYITPNGELLTPIHFEEAGPIKDGLGLIKLNGKWGCIDNSGHIIANPIYDRACSCTEGLVRVKSNGKYGYVGTSGVIVEPIFDDAEPFKDGIAKVKLGEKWGIINKKGDYLFEPIFYKVREYKDGTIVVEVKTKDMEMKK